MKFYRVWRCWSCGRTMPDGQYLDCVDCQLMLYWAELVWKMNQVRKVRK